MLTRLAREEYLGQFKICSSVPNSKQTELFYVGANIIVLGFCFARYVYLKQKIILYKKLSIGLGVSRNSGSGLHI